MKRPFIHVEWDGNTEHALRHGCTKEGIEDILSQRCHLARIAEHQLIRGERRMQINGKTCQSDFYGMAIAPKPERVARPIACWNLATEPDELKLGDHDEKQSVASGNATT